MATKREVDLVGTIVDPGKQIGFRAASLSFIADLYGCDHPFYKSFDEKVSSQKFYQIEGGIQILLAIKKEVDNGWILSVKELLSSQIFADFLEMAEHLLEQGYKDASAVMIGSVLEGHLKFLSEKHNIDLTVIRNGESIPKKADTLNADLRKADIYNALRQKSVTAWLDLRNKAAHGQYTEYSLDQVKLMYSGVLDFTSSVT